MRTALRTLLIALALFAGIAPAQAAIRMISTASGNINATGTWSVIDTTGTNAFLNSETANTALTTSPVASSTFTPASETITAIAVKLAAITGTGPSGTLTVKLANSTSAGNRECTQTVNVADLVQTPSVPTAANADGGWIVLTCSAVPNGTDAYTINANTSVASGVSTVNLFSSATTNWSRFLVTNGTQANGPAAGDQFYVYGNLSGAGTHNAFTVTVNTTANINYGNVANTLVDPSISVGQWGTLASGVAASTAYLAEVAGPLVVYSGGTFTLGTAGTPIPATSSMTFTLNSTVEGDTGVVVRNGGTFNSTGVSGGRSVVKTLLTATATGASTSTLTVADSTGWLSGDSIVIAGTVATSSDAASKYDTATLTSNASGTSVPLTGAVTNTHTATGFSYTSTSTNTAYALNMYPAVINLTRNVVIQGSGATTNGYLYFQANSTAAIAWTGFTLISGVNTTVQKRGVEVDTGQLGAFSLTNSSFYASHNSCLVLAGANTTFGGTSTTNVLIQHNVMYNCANNAGAVVNYGLGLVTATTNPFWEIDDFTAIRCAYGNFNAVPVYISSFLGQFTNITISGSANSGTAALVLQGSYSSKSAVGFLNTWGPITLYANVGYSISIGNSAANATLTGKISGLYIWHENGRFTPQPGNGDLTIDPLYIISNAYGIYYAAPSGATLRVRNGVIGADSTVLATSAALTLDATNDNIYFDNMEFFPVGALGGLTFSATTTNNGTVLNLMNDIAPTAGTTPSQAHIFLRNTSMLNSLGTKYPSFNGQESYFGQSAAVMQDCALCSPVVHAAWLAGGFLSYDTAISHTSGFSLRMTPKIMTWSGYIAGTTLTVTSGSLTGLFGPGDWLTSNGGGFVSGTLLTAGSGTSFTTSYSQTVGSVGSPVQFQSYAPNTSAISSGRLQSASYGQGVKVAVASGQTVQACVWIRPSINTDAAPPWGGSAVAYNGDNPRLINRQNPAMGVASDTVLATFSGSAGVWSQLCGTTSSAPNDGEFEFVVDADQTFTSNAGGWVNIAEWTTNGSWGPSGNQFWWNGLPMPAAVPNGPRIIGGYLLNRDLSPASNDNTPAFMDKAA
jgi:hypothetical protein